MTRDECKRQAMSLVRAAELIGPASAAAERWFAPYDLHDAAIDSGKVLVDQIDPETGEHRTIETQIHPPRPVQAFNFGIPEVRALARAIRMELRL